METYIAQNVSGNQQIQLAAANMQDARSQMEARVQASDDTSVRYTIPEQPPVLQAEATTSLISASGVLLGCLVFLVVAEQKLRSYCKGTRGEK